VNALLLDTNVLSELRKPVSQMDAGVRAWAADLIEDETYLSAVTITEVSRWVAARRRRDARQASLLESWLHDYVLVAYAERIIPVDTDVALIAGPLHLPNPRDYRDTFIAATAIYHGLTVATRNVRDYDAFDVPLINPFEPRG